MKQYKTIIKYTSTYACGEIFEIREFDSSFKNYLIEMEHTLTGFEFE